MIEFLRQLIINLYTEIPDDVYKGLLSILLIVSAFFIAVFGIKKGWRKVIRLLLAEYIFFTFCSTVLVRHFVEEVGHVFTPFWSYIEIGKGGRLDLIADNIMNLAVFVPVGLLLGCEFQSMKWHKVLLIGCGVSFSIEFLQLVLKRGFSETDDVIHNTLGCIIGYGLYSMAKMGYEIVSKRFLAVL